MTSPSTVKRRTRDQSGAMRRAVPALGWLTSRQSPTGHHSGARVTHVLGIHHVSTIAGDPQRNLDFFAGLLGLRLVKRTVNFDDPQTYHLYYGDEVGTPGCIMTFFPWPGARPGRQGPGEVAVTSFSVLPAALGFWLERFVRHGVPHESARLARERRRRRASARISRPRRGDVRAGRTSGGRSATGVDAGVRQSRPSTRSTGSTPSRCGWSRAMRPRRVLVDLLGFRALSEHETTRRYAVGEGGPSRIVDVRIGRRLHARREGRRYRAPRCVRGARRRRRARAARACHRRRAPSDGGQGQELLSLGLLS